MEEEARYAEVGGHARQAQVDSGGRLRGAEGLRLVPAAGDQGQGGLREGQEKAEALLPVHAERQLRFAVQAAVRENRREEPAQAADQNPDDHLQGEGRVRRGSLRLVREKGHGRLRVRRGLLRRGGPGEGEHPGQTVRGRAALQGAPPGPAPDVRLGHCQPVADLPRPAREPAADALPAQLRRRQGHGHARAVRRGLQEAGPGLLRPDRAAQSEAAAERRAAPAVRVPAEQVHHARELESGEGAASVPSDDDVSGAPAGRNRDQQERGSEPDDIEAAGERQLHGKRQELQGAVRRDQRGQSRGGRPQAAEPQVRGGGSAEERQKEEALVRDFQGQGRPERLRAEPGVPAAAGLPEGLQDQQGLLPGAHAEDVPRAGGTGGRDRRGPRAGRGRQEGRRRRAAARRGRAEVDSELGVGFQQAVLQILQRVHQDQESGKGKDQETGLVPNPVGRSQYEAAAAAEEEAAAANGQVPRLRGRRLGLGPRRRVRGQRRGDRVIGRFRLRR